MGVFVISISDSWGAIRESLKKPQKIGHLDTLEALALTGWAKVGLVQSWVTLRKSLGNRLGYSESSLFAIIGRSEPSIPVQRGRAVQGPYCYPKASILEPCPKVY